VTGNSECNSQHADEAPNAYEFELSGLQGAVENFLGALPLNRNIPAQTATQNIVANCGMFFVACADHVYRPHSPRIPPQIHHQNTIKNTRFFPNPHQKSARKT
jgi:hypothetical protein